MGGSTPSMPSPQDSMKAEAMAQLAGSEFNLGSAPLQAYAQAINSLQFDPTFQKIASADSARSALANAQAAKATSANVNPYGSAGADMFSKAANIRLANMMGQPLYPGLTPNDTSQPFQYPSQSSLPAFGDIQSEAKKITSAMPNVNFGNNSVSLSYPKLTDSSQGPMTGGQYPFPVNQGPPSYLSALSLGPSAAGGTSGY